MIAFVYLTIKRSLLQFNYLNTFAHLVDRFFLQAIVLAFLFIAFIIAH